MSNASSQPGALVFIGTFHRVRRGNGHSFESGEALKPSEHVRKPARVARMLAFAHGIKRAIDRGDYLDYADAARQIGLTRARVSQFMDLTLLAPSIQEEILFLERVDGIEPVTERGLREVVKCVRWGEQRTGWARISL